MFLSERNVLEACLTECKRQLDRFRREDNDLQADLAESDMNQMLERLRTAYRLEREHADDPPH